MENLVKKFSSQQVALIVLVLLVGSLFSIFVFKLKLGPDFNASQVVEVQIDHEVSVEEFSNNINSITSPNRIDKESTGKFYLYFQNISTDNISSFINELKTKQSGVLTAKTFNYRPLGEMYLRERVGIVAGLGLFSYLIFSAIKMRKSGITQIELILWLVNDMLSLAFSTIVLLGVGSLLGFFGQTMSISYWDLFLLGVAVLVIMKVYQVHRIRDILDDRKHSSMQETYNIMFKKYWPEFVFIFAFALLCSTLPWTVIQKQLVWAAILPAIASILGLLNFVLIDYHLLKFLNGWIFILGKSVVSISLNRKW